MSMTEMLAQPTSGRLTRGRTPVYRLMLHGEPLEVTVQDATIVMAENTHDTGTLTVSSNDRTTTDGILDSPISFLYGTSPATEVFSGYVTSISEVQNETGVLTWTMEIVGPTKSMQTGAPRFWAKRSIPSAVETLAYSSYLGYTGHAHDHLWTALAQTDESDWKMSVLLAKRLGWVIHNRYGVVGLYDPLQLFLEQGVAATLISETYNIAKSGSSPERVLLGFEPTEVAESSTTQRGLKVAYFNEGQLQVAWQRGEHSTYQFLSEFVIRNAAEAALYVNADDSDSSNWRQTAAARIMGNAALYPGMNVDVLTTSRSWAPGKFNGRWLIRGVQHKMDRQSFQSNLALARPDGKVQVQISPYVPFWQQQSKAKPTLSLRSTTTLLTPERIVEKSIPVGTNIWVSSWTNPTVAAVA